MVAKFTATNPGNRTVNMLWGKLTHGEMECGTDKVVFHFGRSSRGIPISNFYNHFLADGNVVFVQSKGVKKKKIEIAIKCLETLAKEIENYDGDIFYIEGMRGGMIEVSAKTLAMWVEHINIAQSSEGKD